MPAASATAAPMQRSRGVGALEVKLSDGRTRIARLHQSGNAKIRVPKTHGEALEAVLINTSGGITGGDTLAWSLAAGSGTTAIVTTQACERIYRSTGDTGLQQTAISVGEGATLFWLPQETILFEAGRLTRKLDVDLAADARFLGLETLVLGREAMGESVATGFFHDRWRIRGGDGSLVHAEDMRFDLSQAGETQDPAILGTNRVVSTLLAVTPDDAETRALLVEKLRALLKGSTGGASTVGGGPGGKDGGKIVVRLAARSSYDLRKRLLLVLALLLGANPLPRVWSL